MDWYYYIAILLILSQLLFCYHTARNYHYALTRYKKKRLTYRPRTALIVPCKGLDPNFRQNIASFFNQDYENYLLWFVVADKTDPAYAVLCELKDSLGKTSKARDIQVLVAGFAQSCSQKIHNLLHCCQRIDSDVEALAFADSDICIRSDWLSQIVHPLRYTKTGATTGYRWYVPKKNNLASIALSSVNAKIAQLLGNSIFNQAWGGSMAIRVDVFKQLGLDKIWPKTLSDDLSLSYAVKKARKKVVFVPACLVASYESTTWRKLFEFGRRQFLITRVSNPKTWWFGLFSSLYSILGLWGGAALAIYAATKLPATNYNSPITNYQFLIIVAVPILFFTAQFIRAILRQKMAYKLLHFEQRATPALSKVEGSNGPRTMRVAGVADILLFWLWSPLLLLLIISSAFGRTITWRGIRYKLLGPTQNIVLSEKTEPRQ
ncbi:MAG: glycosyltransferase family 2 protein [Phycisphaerae bacterium]|nr:glycosyltransferase family 2 protein [Phycisphaerae bacterium]